MGLWLRFATSGNYLADGLAFVIAGLAYSANVAKFGGHDDKAYSSPNMLI